MTPVGLALIIALPVLLGALAVTTHLMQCHTERLRNTHFSAPMDYERHHYSTLPSFLDGDSK